MLWLDTGDDDEESDWLLEKVSEYWRHGPTTAPRRVFKVRGLPPPLSPLQADLCSEPGFQSLLRDKNKSLPDSDKKSHRQEEMYQVEGLPNSREKQEYTSQRPKHRFLPTSLFGELSKDQFPFHWSKKNSVGLGGSKVLSSDLKKNDRDVRVPAMAQANGIQGYKAKNVQQSQKESTCGASAAHTLSSKTHNGLCCAISFPSNEKLQNYHNPLHGASAAFIHRLTEIAGLECDTIQQEKIRKLKKRLDC